jgi:hypothetical protein
MLFLKRNLLKFNRDFWCSVKGVKRESGENPLQPPLLLMRMKSKCHWETEKAGE